MPGEGSLFIAMLALIAIDNTLQLQPMAHFQGAGVKSEEHGCPVESFRAPSLARRPCFMTSVPSQ